MRLRNCLIIILLSSIHLDAPTFLRNVSLDVGVSNRPSWVWSSLRFAIVSEWVRWMKYLDAILCIMFLPLLKALFDSLKNLYYSLILLFVVRNYCLSANNIRTLRGGRYYWFVNTHNQCWPVSLLIEKASFRSFPQYAKSNYPEGN